MSSFVVGVDHVDYLVSAAYTYAADAPGVRRRDPQALGRLLLQENIATVIGRPWPDDPAADPLDDLQGDIDWDVDDEELEELDDDEMDELTQEHEMYRTMLQSYVHHPVADIDPAQTVVAATCWQYQRGRSGFDHEPESWLIAEVVKERALAMVPPDGFIDPAAARSFDNLAARESLPWRWRRG